MLKGSHCRPAVPRTPSALLQKLGESSVNAISVRSNEATLAWLGVSLIPSSRTRTAPEYFWSTSLVLAVKEYIVRKQVFKLQLPVGPWQRQTMAVSLASCSEEADTQDKFCSVGLQQELGFSTTYVNRGLHSDCMVSTVLTTTPALVLCLMTRSSDLLVVEVAIIFFVIVEAWSNCAPHPPTMVPFSVRVMNGMEKSQGQFGMCRSRHSLAMSNVMAVARRVRTNSLSRQTAGRRAKRTQLASSVSVSLKCIINQPMQKRVVCVPVVSTDFPSSHW